MQQASADQLLARWQAGDESAATELYERYSKRLYDLAAGQMSDRLRRRLAPDDIVQSAFRTFFRRADQWQFQQDRAAAIWHLLVRITLNKVRAKGIFHGAQKRDANAEFALGGDEFDPALVAHEPTPGEAAELADVIEVTIGWLDDKETQALELALLGCTASEIAAQVGCSRWTVRRLLDRIGHRLVEQLSPDDEK